MAKSIQERVKHLENVVKSCCNRFFKLQQTVENISEDLEDTKVDLENTKADLEDTKIDLAELADTVEQKAEKPIVVTPVVVSNTGWNLVGGIYQKSISNAQIFATSVVYIVPENADLNIVQNAEIYPKTLSGVGTVTIYAKTIPTGSFTVTLNIFN